MPVLVSFLAGSVEATSCNATSPCPLSAPCCSEYGFCGTDNFCLGGCNPFASNTMDSCKPSPICVDANHTFTDNSRILSNVTFYDGNATAHDWTLDKGFIFNTNSSGGELAMILTETNGGTRLSSTRYMHYGTTTARIKTGRWAGVVTAFITMSDIKDEIDWEFPGDQVMQGQTNYFWEGVIPDATAGATSNVSSDTFANYHDYTFDWQPDALTFSIDGAVVRTVKKADVGNQYPATPSRIQLSIWPAGIPSSPPGTITWAGGNINWADPDYVSAGHFYALVKSVSIKCTPSAGMGPNITSYVYDKSSTSQAPVINLSNATTLLNGAAVVGVGGLQGLFVVLFTGFLVVLHAL